MPEILITPSGAQRPDGTYVVMVDGLPSAVARDVLAAVSRRLIAAGYRVRDLQIRSSGSNALPLCDRCRIEPVASPRAKYCPQCQGELSIERKRVTYQLLGRK